MRYFAPTKFSKNIKETPEGYLLCLDISIARTGTQIYAKSELPDLEADKEGKIEVLREEKEVFRPETIASFEGKSFVIKHPDDDVSPEDWSKLTKGIMQNVHRGEGDAKDDLVCDILVTDADAIKLIKNGNMRELSCGYSAEYEQTEPGKAKQTKIIGNHVALVDEGRAGHSYKINDHKGKGKPMGVKDKIKAIFAKAQDEAMKIADEEAPLAKEETTDDKSKGYDELVKLVKDLGEKVSALSGKKPATDDAEETEETTDDSEATERSIEERIKALEEKIDKLMEMEASEQTGDDDDDTQDDNEESTDDDDFEESPASKKTGDSKSHAEILAPGLKATKGLEVKALKAAYATKDGKEVINSLTGGKTPNYKSAQEMKLLFVASAELLKERRAASLANTRRGTRDSVSQNSGPMTAEQMNDLNAKYYAGK
jgi:uncharacterized protein